ncbi:MAG: NAD(P)-dependent alcohol dehydrogenase [Cyclobacteriaceae bacterium]|nr:NAD(P)-dependent alcohol dehydrogenase [Cyclobacteriaceae bacterium]
MKAVHVYQYGRPENLTLVDLPKPKIQPNELLVQNVVAAVNPYDCMVRSGAMWFMEGFRFPKILGCESAGIVKEVGKKVKQFKAGDQVIVCTGRRNAYAEYLAVTEGMVTGLPESVNFSEGASLPIAGSTAYDALHELGNIQSGQNILIYGASGSVGSFAVQLAKLAAAHVTGVCSTSNLSGVKALGADEVIDYTTTDFRTLNMKFDIIFDTPSVLKFGNVKHLLNRHGTYIATLPSPLTMFYQLISTKGGKKVKTVFAKPTIQKIDYLSTLVYEKKLKVILDKEYPIEQIAAAHQYSETKRAKGKIIVKF